ncbi:2-C-methyl-D-erythritol 4-phosphate cytidylyltransferase [Mucilaginibacter segetis]|uniref:2-C-methyl-D-erythritol 4-phosphate cytidylyltransferase n=1 Tax=Mucilaginibacter segetis TaxID=2793071 RepID=A0A934PWE1_9SPHI|nr:2-C-methyl-D-erythritol 4-phosphate cytidylyltransferase [Mucilaginibacter segetis]MBK0380907.1 2-C-methyl-D-erythritol 4-phosphate cytidylyltransferase [Mucilaginibacter segetis]
MSISTAHNSNSQSKTYAVIVAGGTGTRMQSVVPKQFLLLNNRPVLMHTIEAFSNGQTAPQIIVVLHADYHEMWRELCLVHNFTIPHLLINGGETRFHSVKNAIDQISEKNVLIAVHDAVRPLISEKVIQEAYQSALDNGTAVTAVKSRDSVRQLKEGTTTALNRDEVYLIQTPQTFRSALIKKAYEQPYTALFTDDASVVESSGIKINLIEGSHSNIKITFPEDIAIAETLIKQKSHQL